MTPRPAQPTRSCRWQRSQLALALLCASACGGKYSRPDETSAVAAAAGEAPDPGFAGASKGGASGAGGARPTVRAAGAGGVNSAGAADAPAGGPSAAGAPEAAAGASGSGALTPSCQGLPTTCGPAGNEDCCASRPVPGGSFIRRANGQNYPATVSDFRLDRYEITVGRFRKFLTAYAPDMIAAGDGQNPNNPDDRGWDPEWNASLPVDASALTTALSCGDNYQTWSDAPGGAERENLPLTCMSWFEAEAFCIWDGGRLPTDAEWTYAASGGNEQRLYPWGKAEPDCTYANYFGALGGTDYCVLPGVGSPNPVGSESPKGDGKWGHADLGGNISEWMQDYARVFPEQCQDCAALTPSNPARNRLVKGGSFAENGEVMQGRFRVSGPGTAQIFGARCARATHG
ncbi:MAG: SUMF1/EgtB/PvdO family nonheme iron enzyme [Myxococcales bacterium]